MSVMSLYEKAIRWRGMAPLGDYVREYRGAASIKGVAQKKCHFIVEFFPLLSPLPSLQNINERRRRFEDNLAAIFMGFVLVFLVCHFPRLLLNIHELITLRELDVLKYKPSTHVDAAGRATIFIAFS